MLAQLINFDKECGTGDTGISIYNPLLKFIIHSMLQLLLFCNNYCTVQLRKEIENMTKELKELKKAKDKLSGLEKQLCDAYANFTIEHARHTERESQLRQQRSCHENFELARKEVEKLSTEAGICTELESF